MRVLVADDDRLTARLLQHTLQGWGLDVLVARNGGEAWQMVSTDSTISLAIVDWMMPGMDGPELCRRVRQDLDRAHLYVLLLTARGTRADLIAGLEAGADDYVVKPFDPGELRARVQVGLRVVGLQVRLSERIEELQRALSEVKKLRGLLPICSYCKSVRSDQDYWERVEDFVSHHHDVRFSHGICPPCLESVMAEITD